MNYSSLQFLQLEEILVTISIPLPQEKINRSVNTICDEIAWDTTGSRNLNNGDFDHAMFVTDVNGVYGSRGTDNIFIAANTTDTTSASMPLAQYCSYPANYFATAQIVGGYYRAIEKNIPES